MNIEPSELLSRAGGEARYEAAVRGAQIAVWTWSQAAGTLYLSPYFWERMGYAPDEVVTDLEAVLGHVHPDDLGLVWSTLQDRLASGMDLCIDFRARRRDGTYRWLRSRGGPYQDANGSRAGVTGALFDVTAEREAAADAERQKARLEAVFDLAPYAIAVTSIARGIVLAANRATEALLGRRREDMLGRSVVELGIWPSLEARNRAFAPALADGKPVRAVRRFRKADGTDAVHEVVTGLIEFDGETCFLTMAQDRAGHEAQEARLHASEACFGAIFETSPIAMVLVAPDPEPRYAEVNAAWLALFGYRRDEVIGRCPRDLGLAADPAQPQRLAARALEGQVVRNEEITLRHRSGRPVEARVSLQPVDVGSRRLVLATVVDVSSENAALRALERREALLAQTGEVAQVGGWELDTATGRFEWTAQTCRLLDLAPSRPPSVRAVLRMYGRGHARRIAAAVARTARTGERFDLETPLRTAAGRHRVVRTEGVVDRSGGTVRIYGALQDVTEQRAAEARERESAERFRAIFRSSPVPIALTELKDGRIVDVNEAWMRATGYSSGQVIGRTTVELGLLPSAEARDALLGPLKQGRRVEGMEIRYRVAGGGSPTFLVSCERLDFDGRQVVLSSFSDITQRARAEEAVTRANETLEQRVRERTAQLEAAMRELESFSYSVSHDLRAPLRGIVGFTEILRSEHGPALPQGALALLDRVAASGKRMSELIDALLELSRVARRVPMLTRVDLSRIAAGILAELRECEPDRVVAFDVQPDVVVTADPALMRVVLANLLGNAWKYSSRKPRTEIAFGVRDTAEGRACFVRDAGDGFDMRYADKLFGAFQRLHGPAEFEGSGVGLATVKRIVERHGGRVWADAAPGQGATFYFTLGAAR